MGNKLKQIFIIFLAFLSFLNCKNKTAELKQGNVVKDLNYHLINELKDIENNIGIEQKLSNDIYLRSFAFYEKGDNHYDLILELQDNITNNVVSKYTFAVEGFVVGDELNNLSDYAKKNDREYEAWFGTPNLTKVNNNCYVIIDVKTKLKTFELVKFFLYDKDGYKGDIGERIFFYDYKIK